MRLCLCRPTARELHKKKQKSNTKTHQHKQHNTTPNNTKTTQINATTQPQHNTTPKTDIIHYADRQLRRHRGSLKAFVAAVPEAAAFYELRAVSLAPRFRFPAPGLLDGITSKEKPILKVWGVARPRRMRACV